MIIIISDLIEVVFNKMSNNNLISMHMIQTTLEDIQKWWGIIVAEINVLLIFIKMKTSYSLSLEHVSYGWEITFEIEQIIVQSIQCFIFKHLLISLNFHFQCLSKNIQHPLLIISKTILIKNGWSFIIDEIQILFSIKRKEKSRGSIMQWLCVTVLGPGH